ncbi:hypothetical protein Vadar_020754 [Vaccinium darrowii]|uniref:Uncharacterized protein n=1 Tax=Vaccinium darrowii TaxID=229202 RepID=A0ACB7XJ81_9ERIC|nr:hypothetical protein Vadar_020754 [Vaccinium darrowii]
MGFISRKNLCRSLASLVVSILVLTSSVDSRFVVEKNSIRVIHPPSMSSEQHDGSIANFGVPNYGGSMVGSVVYPDAGALGCSAFDGGDQRFKSKDHLPAILLLDRGGNIN